MCFYPQSNYNIFLWHFQSFVPCALYFVEKKSDLSYYTSIRHNWNSGAHTLPYHSYNEMKAPSIVRIVRHSGTVFGCKVTNEQANTSKSGKSMKHTAQQIGKERNEERKKTVLIILLTICQTPCASRTLRMFWFLCWMCFIFSLSLSLFLVAAYFRLSQSFLDRKLLFSQFEMSLKSKSSIFFISWRFEKQYHFVQCKQVKVFKFYLLANKHLLRNLLGVPCEIFKNELKTKLTH